MSGAEIDPEVEHHTVVIIGAGQAGLSASWHLTQQGVEHVLLERGTIAHEWKDGRWDNFTLVTPNWQCALPGYEYAGDDREGFMKRDLVYDFVRDYASTFRAPVREHVEVVELTEGATGGFALDTTAGRLTADSVVVATGGYHKPIIPASAERLPRWITQVHSSEYKNAADLPPGAILVVGTGQSGAQIAEDLHLEGRKVHLAVGGAPRAPRFYRGRDSLDWLNEMGVYDIPVQLQPGGLAAREKTNHYFTGRDGGRDIDLRQFALEGMRLYGRLSRANGSTLQFAPTLAESLDYADSVAESIKNDIDGYISREGISAPVEERYVPVWHPPFEATELDLAINEVSTIIWSIGYRADYSWIRVGVFDGVGQPTHTRGVTGVPGLYFLGLPWLYTWGSGRFAGIARDAEYVARSIVGPGFGARAAAAAAAVPYEQTAAGADAPSDAADPGAVTAAADAAAAPETISSGAAG
ncbi:MSMEG_0569 family flavin-dependent oxidoreductase [Subtercola boreus]|uniref:FAD-dependent oxidoreductase n=1 Tax=Subtercola boreus TaxID=120213 RepID=A0A3E0WD92_9MICO|nr:MSMEG_0569 family flavin-dependent oxidoreductase [Subtercola boreus]RFA21058.1 FAD-dependent oxidoreductase [Subtercola boreus]RFA21442.1 FAD-dependent oxidoreductase [Subtercola boreus]RFA27413.1 FAD-dependent oxidoreductase [Subtercola boreus]